jgi:hypothetical protein
MSEQFPTGQPPAEQSPSTRRPSEEPDEGWGYRVPARQGWLQSRKIKVTAELDRNRRGDYTVPTWVLAVALLVVIAAWAAIVVLG